MSLTVEHINKFYHEKNVLMDVTISFEPQKIYGLLGRNGAGKSTLLNIISNRSFATNGQIFLDGKLVNNSEGPLNHIYLMSEDNLFPAAMRIKDIFKISEKFYGDFDWELSQRMRAAFEINENLKFRKLSTGYRSIAKLITALCVPCDYIFLDEPVLGLDANHRELFYSFLIDTYEARPRTFVISTHLIEEIANLLENVIILDRGQVLRLDTIENILSEGKTVSGPQKLVEEFTKDLNVVGEEALGGLANFYISGEINKVIPENIRVAPLSLQAYFIQLTKGKKAM